MHSPSISIFGATLAVSCGPVSSTGFAAAEYSVGRDPVRFADPKRRQNAELLYEPTGCGATRHGVRVTKPTQAARERTESNKFSRLARRNSNRKERQFTSPTPLLNWANTSGIRLFADPQRQSSAWADDMVMDRGAEGAARGCDAV